MNTIQILALLAMFSMSVPAALAFMFWRERNNYIDLLCEAEDLCYEMLRDRDWWRTAAFDASGHDDQYIYCHCTECEVVASLECPF
jgi:hypothetical protein